jgi:hypothetical protein
MKFNKPNQFILLVLLVFLSVISCKKDSAKTSALYVPSNQDVTSKATLQELQQGRVLYIDNCAQCHSLYSPDDFGASQWPGIISNMASKTGMSSSEVTLVKKYLTRGK